MRTEADAALVQEAREWQRKFWLIIASCLGLSALLAVGVWQMLRHEKKLGLAISADHRTEITETPNSNAPWRPSSPTTQPPPAARWNGYNAESARQLPATTARRTQTYEPPAAAWLQPEALPRGTRQEAKAQPIEYTLNLDKWENVDSPYGYFSVRVHDMGVRSINVAVNSQSFRQVEKEKGFETTGTNIVPIHHLNGATVYYVDRIAVSSGKYVLKVIPGEPVVTK